MKRKPRPEAGQRYTVRAGFALEERREEVDGEGTVTLTGHASVFGHEYEVFGGPPWGWTESVERGAFDKTLSEDPDVQLLINHGGLPLARTKSGTLGLGSDEHGLAVRAVLDVRDPDVQLIMPKVQRGDLDEMSFAFYVTRQEWNDEETRRWIREVNINRGDVAIVRYGSNDATAFALRSLMADTADALQVADVAAECRSDDDLMTQARRMHAALEDFLSEADPREPRTAALETYAAQLRLLDLAS